MGWFDNNKIDFYPFYNIRFDFTRAAGAAEDIGSDFVGTFNTSTKGFCRVTFERFMKDCSGGYYPVFNIQTNISGERTNIAIGYK